jgi:hypothetical protein
VRASSCPTPAAFGRLQEITVMRLLAALVTALYTTFPTTIQQVRQDTVPVDKPGLSLTVLPTPLPLGFWSQVSYGKSYSVG